MRLLSSLKAIKSSRRSRRRALRANRLKPRSAPRAKPRSTERPERAVTRDSISRWTVRSRKRPRRARTRSTRRASRRTGFRAPRRSTACKTDRSRRDAVRRSWTASSICRRPWGGRPFRTRFRKVFQRWSSESERNCPVFGKRLAAFRRRTRGSLRRTVPSAVFSRRGRLLLRTRRLLPRMRMTRAGRGFPPIPFPALPRDRQRLYRALYPILSRRRGSYERSRFPVHRAGAASRQSLRRRASRSVRTGRTPRTESAARAGS